MATRSSSSVLTQSIESMRERAEELAPLVAEHEQLTAALTAFEQAGLLASPTSAAPASRATSRAGERQTASTARRGRPPKDKTAGAAASKPAAAKKAKSKTKAKPASRSRTSPAKPGERDRAMLDLVLAAPDGAKVKEVAEKMGISESNAHFVARKLERSGQVRRDNGVLYPLDAAQTGGEADTAASDDADVQQTAAA